MSKLLTYPAYPEQVLEPLPPTPFLNHQEILDQTPIRQRSRVSRTGLPKPLIRQKPSRQHPIGQDGNPLLLRLRQQARVQGSLVEEGELGR